ncbi:hypothetical protein TFLX_04260 [Thermoflexales bacterium]|nr:hypothetical protein TFLX_04260 [Thermoflexales bacterium]
MSQTRQIRIISELRQRPYSTETIVPFIRIRGRRLETAGFEIGDDVQIEVREHQLILTKVDSATPPLPDTARYGHPHLGGNVAIRADGTT